MACVRGRNASRNQNDDSCRFNKTKCKAPRAHFAPERLEPTNHNGDESRDHRSSAAFVDVASASGCIAHYVALHGTWSFLYVYQQNKLLRGECSKLRWDVKLHKVFGLLKSYKDKVANHGVGKVTCENGEGEEVMVFDPLVENPDEASAPVIADPTEPLSGNHLIKRREDMIDVFTS